MVDDIFFNSNLLLLTIPVTLVPIINFEIEENASMANVTESEQPANIKYGTDDNRPTFLASIEWSMSINDSVL